MQLLVVRSLVDRARRAVRDGTAVGSMTAMLVADAATEMVTKTALYHFTQKVDEKGNLGDVLKLLAPYITGVETATETKAALQHRKNRNSVQHHGMALDTQLVRASIDDAERFCELVVRATFGRDFASVSSTELVRHLRNRAHR